MHGGYYTIYYISLSTSVYVWNVHNKVLHIYIFVYVTTYKDINVSLDVDSYLETYVN